MTAKLQHGMMVDGHLGGYVPGGDPNTTHPILWSFLLDELGVTSALDVGCGDGKGFVDWMRERDVDVWGIDGMPTDHPRVYRHDFSRDRPLDPDEGHLRCDLVWSAEFVEHVEERHIPNFLPAFQAGELVLMTHAVPGQPGWHHVNCRRDDYWVGVLAAVGYALDQELTQHTRNLAMQDAPDPAACYYGLTGLAFRRTP